MPLPSDGPPGCRHRCCRCVVDRAPGGNPMIDRDDVLLLLGIGVVGGQRNTSHGNSAAPVSSTFISWNWASQFRTCPSPLTAGLPRRLPGLPASVDPPARTRRARWWFGVVDPPSGRDTMVTHGCCITNRDPCKLLILLELESGLEPLTCCASSASPCRDARFRSPAATSRPSWGFAKSSTLWHPPSSLSAAAQ